MKFFPTLYIVNEIIPVTILLRRHFSNHKSFLFFSSYRFQFPNLNGLADVSNWTHARPVINKAGLTAYPEFDAENEDNKWLES